MSDLCDPVGDAVARVFRAGGDFVDMILAAKEAEKMQNNSLDSMCTTWRHDFGLLSEDMKNNVRNELKQLHAHHVEPLNRKTELLAKANRYGSAAFRLHKWCFGRMFTGIDHATATASLGTIYYNHLGHAHKIAGMAGKFYKEAMRNGN
ncbi:hypothetical protein [Maridesulfovibrio ferrireducens]|uniref:hypothetical protein n=1 Tax=Maridesulfovibrio ferrireducens TaxID=246191 RepID=UPI001A3327C9|nr:hypothetical protein [Maridesulfovibrio ferrireducens]MBI9110267.1 hypothetical protein [Maridesulfovibrio ferrireducens]